MTMQGKASFNHSHQEQKARHITALPSHYIMQDTRQYHTEYKNIKQDSIKAVRHLILNKKFFRQDSLGKIYLLNSLNKKLCGVYSIKKPCKIIIQNWSKGHFNFLNKEIELSNKISLITFLHEFKHFLQTEKGKDDSEHITRGWSLSLFFQASQKHFFKALNKGLILHQKTIKQNEIK